MQYCTILAPAKINLSLAIKERMEDGYHAIETIFQSISLYDRVSVELAGDQITCLCGELSGEENLAYIAAKVFLDALQDHYGDHIKLQAGIKISIEKNIPVQAGLAGGSTDAAAVLKALNRLYHNPFSYEELLCIAKQCGSDTAFCLRGGTQWGQGRGSELTEFPPLPQIDIILAKPPQGVNTGQAYSLFSKKGIFAALDKESWYQVLESGNKDIIGNMLYNSLEAAAYELVPEIKEIKKIMLDAGCKGALMSGSGSSVFGILKDIKQGKEIGELLTKKGFPDYWIINTVGADFNSLVTG